MLFGPTFGIRSKARPRWILVWPLADDALAFPFRNAESQLKDFFIAADYLSPDQTNVCFKQLLSKSRNNYGKEKKPQL